MPTFTPVEYDPFEVVPIDRDISATPKPGQTVPYQHPGTAVSRVQQGVGQALAPNIMRYLYPPQRPINEEITPYPSGKLPPVERDYGTPALLEAAQLGIGGMAGGAFGMGAKGAAALLPEAAEEAAPMLSRLPNLSSVDNRLLAGTSGAATGMDPSTAQAAPKLTPEQRQQLEFQRQQGAAAAQVAADKAKIEAEAAQRQAEIKAQADRDAAQAHNEAEANRIKMEAEAKQREIDSKLAAEKQARDDQFAAEQRENEAKLKREEEERYRQTNMPFKDRFPTVSALLPTLGTAGAFLAPFTTRMLAINKVNNELAQSWISTVERTEAELKAGNKLGAMQGINQLQQFANQWARRKEGMGGLGMATSAMLPTEAALVPSEYNAAMLPADDPNRKQAMETLTNPAELARRAIPGILQGLPAATLGGKLPTHRRMVVPPEARSEGLVKSYTLPKPPSISQIVPKAPRQPKPKKAKAPAGTADDDE